MNIDNKKIKEYYDSMKENYLSCWKSLAKKDINKFEIEFIDLELKKLEKKLDGKIKVLEIGFGPGRITDLILKHNVDYFGVDISIEMTDFLKNRFKDNKKIKNIKRSDISQSVPFEEEKFDLVIAWRVLYYNRNWREILERLSKKLKTRGTLIFTMPNLLSLAVLGNLMGGIKGYYTSIREIKGLLEKNGIEGKIFGFARIPDTIYDLCDSEKSAIFLRKFEGFLRSIFNDILFTKMFYIISTKKGGEQ